MILRMTSSGELLGLSVTEVKRKIEAALYPDVDASSLFVSRFKDFISRCKANRTREIYQVTLEKVKAFEPHYSSLRFEAITKDWLSKFEVFLSESGCKSVNARAIHLRNIRAVFNDAIDNGVTSAYPFRKFKIKTEALGDLMRKAATANGKHLSSLDAAIFDYSNIGGTTTNVHYDCRE